MSQKWKEQTSDEILKDIEYLFNSKKDKVVLQEKPYVIGPKTFNFLKKYFGGRKCKN